MKTHRAPQGDITDAPFTPKDGEASAPGKTENEIFTGLPQKRHGKDTWPARVRQPVPGGKPLLATCLCRRNNDLPAVLEIPHLDTLNIGHSIVARALFVGMREAVTEMLSAMGASA